MSHLNTCPKFGVHFTTSQAQRQGLRETLLDFMARRKHRTTMSDEAVERSTNRHKAGGVFYGQW